MRTALFALTALMMLCSVGCSTAPSTAAERAELVQAAQDRLAQFQREHPGSYEAYTRSAAGIAVFPSVGKGGYILGGLYGKGVVFEDGEVAGYCDITSVTGGAQVGGQEYSQVIFFENQATLDEFKRGRITGTAQATAVAIGADASANAEYEEGVAVFTFDANGAMAEAAVGLQDFDFVPASLYDDN